MKLLRLPLTALFFIAALAAVVHWFYQASTYQPGIVTADPHSYFNYAESLKEGKFHVEDPLTDIFLRHTPPPEVEGTLRQGPVWNTTVNDDGKVSYTVAIGYPLFQSLMLRIGGLPLALMSNVILWGFVVLFAFLIIYEGGGRDVGAAAAAALGAAILPFYNVYVVTNILQGWREPLFIACLLGAAWLLLRFWRRPGVIGPCVMALLLGYACSTKEANIIYLPVYGLIFLVAVGRHMRAASDTEKNFGVGKVALLLVFATAFGLLGLMPIFIHNYLAGGNPLVSPQAVRATADLSAGDGLNIINPYIMSHWYWFPFSRKFAMFRPWVMVFALIGLAWLGLRHWRTGEDERDERMTTYIFAALGIVAMGVLYWLWGVIEVMAGHKILTSSALTWCLSAAGVILFVASTFRGVLYAWLAGMILFHLGLYLSWSNMDVRHMILACVLYFMCVGCGIYGVCAIFAALFNVAPRWRPVTALPVMLCLSILILNWKPWYPRDVVFRPKHGQALAEWFEEKQVPERAVIFAQRRLSEIVDLHLPYYCMRLHELMPMTDEDTSIYDLLAEFEADDRPLYYLDSRDLDPKTKLWSRGLDWLDPEILKFKYEMVPVATLGRDDFKLNYSSEEKETITLFQLNARSSEAQSRRMVVPAEGAAFLEVDSKNAGTNATWRLEHESVEASDPYITFKPIHERKLDGIVQLTSGPGVPNLEAAKLIGWDDRIIVEPVMTREGYDANPARFEPRGFTDIPDGTPFAIPVRWREDAFSVVGLNVSVMHEDYEAVFTADEMTNVWVTLRDPWQQEFKRQATDRNFFFPFHRRGDGEMATNAMCSVRIDEPGFYPRIHRLTSELAYRELTIKADETTSMVIVYGRLAASDPGSEKSRWILLANGTKVDEGVCYSNPLRSANAFRRLFTVKPGEDLHLRFSGAGLIQRDIIPVRTRLEIPATGERPALFTNAFHNPESGYMWTKGCFTIPVPVIPGAKKYTLTIEGLDGHPDYPARPLNLKILGQEKSLQLVATPTFHHITFDDIVVDQATAAELEFDIEPWRPQDRDPSSPDERTLGFHLIRFIWEPAWR